MNHLTPGFYVTGGTLRQAEGAEGALWGPVPRPSSLERQADKELFEGLLVGEFCYVLTSRQMGKSSLTVMTLGKARRCRARSGARDRPTPGPGSCPRGRRPRRSFVPIVSPWESPLRRAQGACEKPRRPGAAPLK
jgi:hypothetical protein